MSDPYDDLDEDTRGRDRRGESPVERRLKDLALANGLESIGRLVHKHVLPRMQEHFLKKAVEHTLVEMERAAEKARSGR